MSSTIPSGRKPHWRPWSPLTGHLIAGAAIGMALTASGLPIWWNVILLLLGGVLSFISAALVHRQTEKVAARARQEALTQRLPQGRPSAGYTGMSHDFATVLEEFAGTPEGRQWIEDQAIELGTKDEAAADPGEGNHR